MLASLIAAWARPARTGACEKFLRNNLENNSLEDRSHIRTGHGLANNAALNNLAVALIKYSGQFATVGDGLAHYSANREAALEALLTRQ